MSTAAARSPFDPLVTQITQSPQYLSVENARALLEIVKKQYPKLIRPDDARDNVSSPQDLLRQTVMEMADSIKKINLAASTGDPNGGGMSAADLSKLLTGQEKYIKILERLGNVLTANERQSALENAITEALDEIADKTLKESFLAKFRANLVQKTKDFNGNK